MVVYEAFQRNMAAYIPHRGKTIWPSMQRIRGTWLLTYSIGDKKILWPSMQRIRGTWLLTYSTGDKAIWPSLMAFYAP